MLKRRLREISKSQDGKWKETRIRDDCFCGFLRAMLIDETTEFPTEGLVKMFFWMKPGEGISWGSLPDEFQANAEDIFSEGKPQVSRAGESRG